MWTKITESILGKKKKKYRDTCSVTKKGHVYRFNRYIGRFKTEFHPRDPRRFPDRAVFRCTECGCEFATFIRTKK